MTSTRDRIIGAALTLVNERGLSGVTMIDVARTAGISRQTLYNHYPDIDSIVADALSRHNQESVEMLRSAVDVARAPADKVTQLVRHVAQVSTHHGHSIDLEQSLAPEHRTSLGQFTRALDDVIARIIIQGQADGVFRADLEPTIDTALVRYLLTGVSNLVAADPNTAAAIADAGCRTILAALGEA